MLMETLARVDKTTKGTMENKTPDDEKNVAQEILETAKRLGVDQVKIAKIAQILDGRELKKPKVDKEILEKIATEFHMTEDEKVLVEGILSERNLSESESEFLNNLAKSQGIGIDDVRHAIQTAAVSFKIKQGQNYRRSLYDRITFSGRLGNKGLAAILASFLAVGGLATREVVAWRSAAHAENRTLDIDEADRLIRENSGFFRLLNQGSSGDIDLLIRSLKRMPFSNGSIIKNRILRELAHTELNKFNSISFFTNLKKFENEIIFSKKEIEDALTNLFNDISYYDDKTLLVEMLEALAKFNKSQFIGYTVRTKYALESLLKINGLKVFDNLETNPNYYDMVIIDEDRYGLLNNYLKQAQKQGEINPGDYPRVRNLLKDMKKDLGHKR